MTRAAGFLPAFLIPAGAAYDDPDTTADQAADDEGPGTGTGDGAHDGGTGSSAVDAAAAGGGAEDANDDAADDSIRDEKIKALSDEAATWRKKFRDLDAQHAEGQPLREEVADLRLEKEFYRLAAQRVRDLDAAFKLADRTLLTFADDGNVSGMETMVDKVIQNYPFLSDEPETPATRTTLVPEGRREGGSPSNGRRQPSRQTTTPSLLRKRFPALRAR